MSVNEVYPIIWIDDHVRLIDQNRLPETYTLVDIRYVHDMAEAIRTMIVRGAPAIGVAAAYGMYLGARDIQTTDPATFLQQLEAIAQLLKGTRPTAVNLFWAVARMLKTAHETPGSVPERKLALLEAAKVINTEDIQTCKAIGDHGLNALLNYSSPLRILTHCNAGALATAGYGTSLGVVRSVWRAGRLAMLYADETRPRFQGAKLTTWECIQEGIPVTLITDSMAAHCMQRGLIDVVIVGADRIAANGDTANKIGTYGLALVAKAHDIPFYVAAPLSTIDFNLVDGSQIPIEERQASEVYQLGSITLCPQGVNFYNPAFDVTPAPWITGIITEYGVYQPDGLKSLSGQQQ